MKRTLAILIAMLMVLSCVPVSAITLETAEAVVPEVVAEETVDLASELDITNDEDLYDEELGQLILYYDFDAEDATNSTYAYKDESFVGTTGKLNTTSGISTEVVVDPTDEGNKVLKLSQHDFVLRTKNLLTTTGTYTIVYDAYAAAAINFGNSYWSTGEGSTGVAGAHSGAPIGFTSAANTWTTNTSVSISLIKTEDGYYFEQSNGKTDTNANGLAGFTWYGYTAIKPAGPITEGFVDNIALYMKPLTTTFVIGDVEEEYELEDDVATVLPFIDEFDYTGDFYGWKIGDLVYNEGAAVSNMELVGKTIEIQTTEIRNEVTYRVGNTTKAVDLGDASSIVLPTASEANPGVWTDTDTVWLMDGVLYEAGDEVQTAAIRNKTFTAVDAENEAGKLILYYDFDATDATTSTFAYKDTAYVGTTGNLNTSNGTPTEVAADPAEDVTGNNVLKVNTHDVQLTYTDTFTRNGVYTIKYDGYATEAVTFTNSTWRTGTGSSRLGSDGGDSLSAVITTTANAWTKGNTIVPVAVVKTASGYFFEELGSNHTTAENTNGLAGFAWYGYNKISSTSTLKNVYLDNIAFYYAPLTATFANGETTATVELGEEANFKMPAASTLNIGYEGEHYGWQVDETTAYAVGAAVPVKDLFGKTLTVLEAPLANEATFSFYGKTATADLGEGANYTFVAPTAIDSTWTETFSKWYFDGNFYGAGDTIAKSAIIGKTVEHVVFDSAEHGTLVYYTTYENSDYHATSKPYVYMNTTYFGKHYNGFYPYVAGAVSHIDNPYGQGKVLKITEDTDAYFRISEAAMIKDYGTYTVVFDGYTENAISFSNTFWRIDSDGNNRPYNSFSMNTAGAWDEYVIHPVTYAKNSDNTVSSFINGKHYTSPSKPSEFVFYSVGGARTFFMDNIKVYYKPLELTYVNGDEKVTVKPGEVTSITLPEYSAVDADWTGSFVAWNINGVNYQPGATVDIEDVLGYEITAIKNVYYVNYRGEVLEVEGTQDAEWVLPAASSVDADWTATAYAFGNEVYMPGDEIAAADLLGNTLIAIDAVKFDETKGELVLYFGFEGVNSNPWKSPTYYNTEYITDPTNLYINYGSSPDAEFESNGHITSDGDNTVMRIDRTGKYNNFSFLQANYYGGAFAAGFGPKSYVSATGRVKPIDVDAGTIADTYGEQAFGFNNNDNYRVVMDTSAWEYGVWQEFGGNATGGLGKFSAIGFKVMNAEEGKKLSYVVDDFAVYMFPAHKLYFMAEQGADEAYFVEAEVISVDEMGTVIVPTPAQLGMDVDAQCWMSASGTVLNFGDEITPAEFASEVYYPAQVTAPVAEDTAGFNTILDGIRFKASVSAANAAVLEEYGFLVARKTILGDADLTFEFTTEEAVTKAYITAVAYDKSEGIEELLSVDENGATEFAIACFGFEEDQKDEVIVARPYAKYFVSQNEVVIYGNAVSSTYNNAAQGAGALAAVAPTVQG